MWWRRRRERWRLRHCRHRGRGRCRGLGRRGSGKWRRWQRRRRHRDGRTPVRRRWRRGLALGARLTLKSGGGGSVGRRNGGDGSGDGVGGGLAGGEHGSGAIGQRSGQVAWQLVKLLELDSEVAGAHVLAERPKVDPVLAAALRSLAENAPRRQVAVELKLANGGRPHRVGDLGGTVGKLRRVEGPDAVDADAQGGPRLPRVL
mmetsp:Transcript_65537/g.129808  ORF Transcript_65537/g.129808 Transcript_65537/m.129808 type:complete len:203 (+) Transcript_65537:604-1212(+)